MGQPVHARVPALKPSRQEVDREWKAVHLGEKGNEKGTEGSERPPITARPRLEKAIGK
jgi:hypothetical protein